MKKLTMIALFAGFLTVSLKSCRDQETKEETLEETLIEDMQDKGADIKVKDDGDKIKMKTEDEKVKIKTDEDGDTKIKVKDRD